MSFISLLFRGVYFGLQIRRVCRDGSPELGGSAYFAASFLPKVGENLIMKKPDELSGRGASPSRTRNLLILSLWTRLPGPWTRFNPLPVHFSKAYERQDESESALRSSKCHSWHPKL